MIKSKRKIIEINEELCDGCGNCINSCAEGAIEIIEGKARVISDNLCDGLGACLGDCPQNALKIIERDADEFDEEAVEKHLEKMKNEPVQETMACGCPSANIQEFSQETPCCSSESAGACEPAVSTLTNWPIQITLVPPSAPFLMGSDLLVAADCVPVAFPSLHSEFLKGRSVLIGCPKLDDQDSYIEKFKQIFMTAGLKSITCLTMEVPCCAGLHAIVTRALEESGADIPFEVVIIGIRGEVMDKIRVA